MTISMRIKPQRKPAWLSAVFMTLLRKSTNLRFGPSPTGISTVFLSFYDKFPLTNPSTGKLLLFRLIEIGLHVLTDFLSVHFTGLDPLTGADCCGKACGLSGTGHIAHDTV